MFKNWFSRNKRSAAVATVDPALWLKVEASLPFLGHLSPTEHRSLRELALQFLATKEFSGGNGFAVGNETRLSIALQACLLILHLGIERYEGWVGIIVYPGDFVIPRQTMDQDGVIHEFDDAVLGEAWAGGPVLLSWFDDAADLDGVNVVLHEFAHKLDMQNGEADGMPRLRRGMHREAWRDAMFGAYEHFCRRVDAGEDTALDPYAAETPGEFFAVMSEAFFETPQLLHGEYPAVYRQLRQFYGQNTLVRS
jgi:Mlc titration factor MtfA (ptsG expression regulator)